MEKTVAHNNVLKAVEALSLDGFSLDDIDSVTLRGDEVWVKYFIRDKNDSKVFVRAIDPADRMEKHIPATNVEVFAVV